MIYVHARFTRKTARMAIIRNNGDYKLNSTLGLECGVFPSDLATNRRCNIDTPDSEIRLVIVSRTNNDLSIYGYISPLDGGM